MLFSVGCTGVKLKPFHSFKNPKESISTSSSPQKSIPQNSMPNEAIWDSDELFDFSKFQENEKTSLRSRETIEIKFNIVKDDLVSLVEQNKAKFPIPSNIDFQVRINRNGSAYVQFFPESVELDSLVKIDLENTLKMVKFDSINGIGSCAKINGKIMNLKELMFLDSTKYYPYRTRASIMKTVMKNVGNLRYCYNRYLRNGEDFKGKVTVKFAIDEYGKIIFISVINQTVNKKEFEEELVRIIKEWKFKRLHNTGDVTEVVYPFVFSR